MTDWNARWIVGDTPWDKGAPAPPLVDWLRENGIEGEVLVPGCGSGHDVRALAAAGASVTGVDVAAEAVRRARQFSRAGSELYFEEDFFGLPGAFHGRFDWVFEHTCFCAIDPSRRPDYVAAVLRALRPGGQLLAIFYVEPDADAGPPFRISRDELDAVFGAAFELIEEFVPRRAFAGREGRELVRHYRRR